MHGRTFFRMMIDILFINNPFCRAISTIVNFCNNQRFYNKKELKFFRNVPLSNIEHKYDYKKKFIFDSSQATGAYLK